MISRGTLILGAAPLFVFFASAQAAGDLWRERLIQAEKLSQKNDNAQAVKIAQGVLSDADKSLGPDDPEAGLILARVGRICAQAEDDASFPEMEKRLAAVKTKGFEVWLVLGKMLREEGKLQEAEDALKKALALRPDDPEAEISLAQTYADMGRFEEELRPLMKAIEKNPHEYSSYSQLANAYVRLGRSVEAKETFARARKINGNAAQAYIDEGYFDLNSGEPAHAREDFENAIAVDTSSPLGYHHMGSFLSQSELFPEAEKYLSRALELLEADPKTQTSDLIHTLERLGRVMEAEGRPAEAEAVFRRCLEKSLPTRLYVSCAFALGVIYFSQNKHALAEETLHRAVAVCEEGPACSCRANALIGLGRIYLDGGRRREAAAMANEAEKLCASFHSDVEAPMTLMEIDELYFRLGDIPKEDELHARIMAERSSRGFNFILSAMAQRDMERRRFSEAEDLYRQGIQIFRNRGDRNLEAAMLEGLAAACEKEDKPQEAAEAREKEKKLRATP